MPGRVLPGSTLTVCGPTTVWPWFEANTGSNEIIVWNPVTSSQGNQMLYESPRSVTEWRVASCSSVNTNFRLGVLLGFSGVESSNP
ncbi:MAG: hypothetical protein EA424_27635 [Planctomycetaceae bacterium]|nr:MAG: hypothetical protein EA424_27635 [Planctomycetaceae bacterium]